MSERRSAMGLQQALDLIGLHAGSSSIATAESVTAGRIACRLACIPSAASFFRGGLVAYQEAVKRELLGVVAESVYTPRAASEMAAGAARLLGASISVATTGVAGDAPTDGVPPGTVFIGLWLDGAVRASSYRFDGDPTEIAERAAEQAIVDLALALTGS